MHETTHSKTQHAGNWLAAILLSLAHLLAFGMLYLVLVQLNWSFQDFYKLVGTRLTPEFERIASISNSIAASTPLVLLVVALDIFIIFRFARNGSRWTSAYSHAVLLCIGFTGFLWTARSVEPMAWGAPGVGNPPAVNNAQAGKVVESTEVLQQIGELANATERRRQSNLALVTQPPTPADRGNPTEVSLPQYRWQR